MLVAMVRPSLLLILLLAVAMPWPSDAMAPQASAIAADGLQPGQYQWTPEQAPTGPVVVFINLPAQRAYVYRDGVRIGTSTVSTGKPGHRTPPGVYTIVQKRREHYSNLYDDAPMPFMQRLSWDGLALHSGSLPGHPASHGCVRLPAGFAEALFRETRVGTVVVIAEGGAPLSVAEAPGVLAGGPPTATPAVTIRPRVREGVRTVINLRAPEEAVDYDEAAEAARLGLRYVSLPVRGADDLDREHVRDFGNALDQARTHGGVLIHCASANRVGAMVGLDQALNRNCSLDAALAHGRRAGLQGLEPTVVALAGREGVT